MRLAANLKAVVLFAVASVPGHLSDALTMSSSPALNPSATFVGSTGSTAIRSGGLCAQWKG